MRTRVKATQCCVWVKRNFRGEAIIAKGPYKNMWVDDIAQSSKWKYLVALLDEEDLTDEEALTIEESLDEAKRPWEYVDVSNFRP